MAEFALRELIDEKRLQHLQNEFCKVTGVTAVCVDKEGRAITEPYIDKSLIRPDGEDPILGEYRKKAAQALDRVQEGGRAAGWRTCGSSCRQCGESDHSVLAGI